MSLMSRAERCFDLHERLRSWTFFALGPVLVASDQSGFTRFMFPSDGNRPFLTDRYMRSEIIMTDQPVPSEARLLKGPEMELVALCFLHAFSHMSDSKEPCKLNCFK
jgi:hypothetical protein